MAARRHVRRLDPNGALERVGRRPKIVTEKEDDAELFPRAIGRWIERGGAAQDLGRLRQAFLTGDDGPERDVERRGRRRVCPRCAATRRGRAPRATRAPGVRRPPPRRSTETRSHDPYETPSQAILLMRPDRMSLALTFGTSNCTSLSEMSNGFPSS